MDTLSKVALLFDKIQKVFKIKLLGCTTPLNYSDEISELFNNVWTSQNHDLVACYCYHIISRFCRIVHRISLELVTYSYLKSVVHLHCFTNQKESETLYQKYIDLSFHSPRSAAFQFCCKKHRVPIINPFFFLYVWCHNFYELSSPKK